MNSWLRSLYIPLFTQITIPFILLASFVAAGGTYIVTRLIFDSLEDRFTNQLVETTVLAKDSMVRTEADLLETLRLASNIQGIDAVVLAGDAETARRLVEPAAFNSGVQAFGFLSASGEPITLLALNGDATGYEPLETAPWRDQPYVQAVLDLQVDERGDKFAGLQTTGRGDYLFVAGPVTDGDGNLVGVAVVGLPVAQLAEMLRTETVAQVSFYAQDGRVVASTFVEPEPLSGSLVADVLSGQDTGSRSRTHEEGTVRASEILSAWEVRGGDDLGVMGVALSTNFLVQASQFSRENTLVFMLSMLGFVVLVGLVVARSISRPINKLREAAEEVSRGNLQVKVPKGSSNEIGVLNQSFNQMVGELNSSKEQLLNAYDRTIEGWAKATDMRDHETEGHSRRVADLTVALAKSMGFKDESLLHIYRGALLHDIGKIGIPDGILLKPGKLTPEERLQMQLHPQIAEEFIGRVDFLRPAMDIPSAHHEKWDGTGYPRGLKGEQIPLPARIFAIVDVWDALTSDRPYRAAMGVKETLALIEGDTGKHFDPQVVAAFKKMMGL